MSRTAKTGLVGFFDILGYQNLLESNEPEKIAEEVLPILNGLKKTGNEELYRIWTRRDRTLEGIIASMEWLIFSDTILLTLPFPEDNPSLHNPYWLTFLLGARFIQTNLFKAGLPARGAIDYGTYHVDGSCFAGRCIVEAHKLSSKLEIAACVLSTNAAKQFQSNEDGNMRSTIERRLLMKYLVPMKDSEEHLLTVKVAAFKQPEIRREVMQAFWGNGKDISRSVHSKIRNTEQWLELLEMKSREK